MKRSDRLRIGIDESQMVTSYLIKGVEYPRIRYGFETEDWGADKAACHDCEVTKGLLHIVGCDVERCPCCGGQAIYCECHDED